MLRFICCFPDGSQQVYSDCLRFSLLRDRYLPYAALHIQLLTEQFADTPIRVQLFCGQKLLHEGIPVKARSIRKGGGFQMQITSHGFSSLLVKNQLVPGVHSNLTLSSLLTAYQLPHITFQDNVEAIRYIYVMDNASMWDTLIAYNYKLNGGFPYVRAANHLCVLPQTGSARITVPRDAVLCFEKGCSLNGMLSRIDMADMNGEYGSYSRSNPLAAQYGIVRVKQILLDKQYAYNPDDALRFRIALGNRRLQSKTVSYCGYCGEDTEDLVEIENMFAARVSRILLTGTQDGITTTDTFYYDDFCNS